MTNQIPTNYPNIKLRHKLMRWFGMTLLIVVLAGAAMSSWIFTTTPGLQWLLSTTSKMSSGAVHFDGVNGTFSAIRIQSIHIANNDKQFKLDNFRFDWQPLALLSKQLIINQLAAHEVEILSPPSSDPLLLPDNLILPFSISIQNIEINSLSFFSNSANTADFSITHLETALESDGQHHQLTHLTFNSEFGLINASAQLDGIKPFDLTAQMMLTGLTDIVETTLTETRIHADINGNLSELNVTIEATGDVLNGNGNLFIQPFASFPVAALRLEINGFNPRHFSPEAPDSNLLLSINLQENHQKQLTGTLLIENDQVKPLDQGGLPLHKIITNLKVTQDLLHLDGLSLDLSGDGLISGDISWDTTLSSGLANLTVAQLNPQALDTRLQAARINGRVQLDGDTEIQRGIITLEDEAFNLNAQITHTAEAVTLQELQLKRNQSELTGQGELHLDEQQLFNFKGNLKHFNVVDFIQAPESDLNAHVELTGNLNPHPSGSLSFKFENSQFATQPVSGYGDIEFDNIDRAKVAIELSIGSNHLHTHGKLGAADDRMQVEITAPKLDQLGLGIEGALQLKTHFGGSLSSPALQFDLTGDNLSFPGDHRLDHINAQGKLHDEAIKLNIHAENYHTAEKTQLQQLNVAMSGHQSDHQIQTDLQINDKTNVTLQVAGGLLKTKQINPTFYWAGELSKLSATGALPFHLLATTKFEVGANHAVLGDTKLSLGGGEISINNTRWTPNEWQSQGHFTGISLRPGSDTEKAQETLQLGGAWNVTATKQLTGSLQIDREKGDWIHPGELPFPLGLEQLQLTAHTNHGKVSAELTVKGQHIGSTQATITLPLTLSDAGWRILPNAAIDGQLTIQMNDISRIGSLLGDNIESGGRLDLQAKLNGTFGNPEFQGTVYGTNLTFALLDQGLQLQQGKLDAHFDHASLHINTFNFTSPFVPLPNDRLLMDVIVPEEPGKIEMSGVIGIIGNDSNIKIELDHLPLALQSHHWIIASGNGHANFSDNTLTLGGNMIAEAGILTRPPTTRPQLANDIIISGETPQGSRNISINLDAVIDLGKHFYVRAAGLEGALTGKLHLKTNDQNNLTATGSIATNKAKYLAYGQHLTVDRGVVNFNGPLDDPGLNILAMRNDVAVNAGIEISGSVRRPLIRLVSTPDVSDAEKLSWIVFGRSLSSDNVDTSLLLSAANSILGGQTSGDGLTQQLSRALGVDEISVRQAGNDSPLTSQIGTVGKRISSRAYLSYERGLTTANIGITKLTYSLTPKINVVTQAGLDSAVDVFYIFQFD